MPTVTSWGYEELDDIVGEMVSGRLYVIGARPSCGKSTLMLNVLNMLYANLAAAPRKILCYWTEVSVESAYTLWAALRLGLPEDDVLAEKWAQLPDGSRETVEALREQLEAEGKAQRAGSWIWFADAVRPTQEQVREDVEQMRPDVVFFDYLQKVRPGHGEDRFAAIGSMAGALQTLAVRHQCAMVVGSQLKRKGDAVFDKYKAPDLEDMKGAGEIEESADVVMGLFRRLRAGITSKDEKAIRAGERPLAEFVIPNAMMLRVLKHKYRGSAADTLIRLRLDGKRVYGQYTTREESPVLDRGDAYEEAEPVQSGMPF
jgi:replicative DNA helicase